MSAKKKNKKDEDSSRKVNNKYSLKDATDAEDEDQKAPEERPRPALNNKKPVATTSNIAARRQSVQPPAKDQPSIKPTRLDAKLNQLIEKRLKKIEQDGVAKA